jgi:type I restriction enzyme S subunit
MKSNYKPIGKHIRLVDERNKGLQVQQLLGLSISKQFIPSVANIIGTDMENYKIIRKNQFACSTMQVRRDKKMPVALLKDLDEAIISQAYPIFEVKDTKELLPEYLMMWFERAEFDREACFHAVGGVRGSLEWEDFESMQLPIPHIDKQREIVKEYNTIQNRIALNQQLIQKLEETVQAIYREWFVEFEFPDENGKPYKSSGGEMVWSEELGKESPMGWNVTTLLDYCSLSQGIQVEVEDQLLFREKEMNRFLRIIDYTPNTEEPPRYVKINDKRYYCSEDEIAMIRYGDAGTVCRRFEGIIANNLFKITPVKPLTNNFLYNFLIDKNIQQLIRTSAASSTMPAITHSAIKELPIVLPSIQTIDVFDKLIQKKENEILIRIKENQLLKSLKELLLSKLATIE